MEETTILAKTRVALGQTAERLAGLLHGLADAEMAIPASRWTVRQAAAHLVSWAPLYAEVAGGMPSPVSSLRPDDYAAENAQRLADVAETDPARLADLVVDATGFLLKATAGRLRQHPVTWHCGIQLDVAQLMAIYAGELLLHGYDMATAVGQPWPIDPAEALLVLSGYGPCYEAILNPSTTAGLTAAYEIELRGGGRFAVRFDNGAYELDAAGSSPTDCSVGADPVAFLMVAAGRLSASAAVALGLIEVTGGRPELALSFNELFLCP